MIDARRWYQLNTVLLCAVFAFLWTPFYSWAIKVFLVVSVLSLGTRPWHVVTSKQALFAGALLAYTLFVVVRDSLFYAAFEPKQLFLLAIIPVWLNLIRHGADARGLATGVAIGALCAGAYTWQASDGLALRLELGRNAISFGGAMLVYVSLCLFYLWKQPWCGRWLWVLALVASLVAMASSGTRGTYIPVIMMMTLVAATLLRAGRWWVLLCLPVLLAGLATGLVVSGRWAATVAELQVITSGNLETSIGHRLQLWQLAWQVFTDHPAFGFGPDSGLMNKAYAEWLLAQGFYPTLIEFRAHMHNQYFDLLAKYGAVGLLLWLFWLGTLWWTATPAARWPATFLLIAFFGLALTETIMGTNALRYALLAAMMAVFSMPRLWCNTRFLRPGREFRDVDV